MKRLFNILPIVSFGLILGISAVAQSSPAGEWDVALNTPGGVRNFKAVFRYKGLLGEADLTGTVKGDKIEFSFKVSGQLDGTVVYAGTTDGKTMKGKVNLAGAGEGTFSGKKQ